MNHFKSFLFSFILLTLSVNLSALSVDEEELKSTGPEDKIVFQNYTGPHSKIDTLEQIKSLGSSLAPQIKENKTSYTTAGDLNRYYVIHAVDPNEKSKLDADIFIIGKNATVDHIKNLRIIIASYLSGAYGYSEKDSLTIATFVTVYNAVYRNKIDTFSQKYKNIVVQNLTEKDAGLSVNWKDWAGSSQIVIPLFDVKNEGVGTVDTSIISDKEVVKRMQDDEDKNVDTRKDMVELKEREAEKAQEKAQNAQKEAASESKKAQEEKQKTEEIKKEAENAKKDAETAKKKAEENPTKENIKAAEEKTQEAQKKQEELEQQQEKQDAQEKKAEEAKKDAQEQQQIADKKNLEAQEERREIAKDMQEVINKELQDALSNAVYGMELTDEKELLSGMIKINSKTGEIMKQSPVTYIRNRTMFQAGENYIAVCGENSGNGAVKLVLLSPDTMEIEQESNEIVHENSVLIQDDSNFYCIIQDGKNWVLGKYDENLTLLLKSNVPLKSSTPVTITEDKVIVTGVNGNVKLLEKQTLKEISQNSTYDAK